ncbi:MAG: alpha/beta fold hydrolase [PVC group bacterium]|nr:alpha/beta fold hydrolase [PVC group bacterium]
MISKIKTFNFSEDLEAYLKKSEGKFSDIRPCTEKTIFWSNPDKKDQTPLSIIYLHGFSSSRQDTSPLCENIAKKLNANLFCTRLTGHGRPGHALGEASVTDWLSDTVEAIEIGQHIGKKVIVIGISTGSTLAMWLATSKYANNILGFILLSPNFGINDPRAKMLNLPCAKLIVPLFSGKDYTWKAQNPQQTKYWTMKYPTVTLVTLAKLVRLVKSCNPEKVKHPILFIFSSHDQVVLPQATENIYSKIKPDLKQIVRIENSQDPENHVLAGNILAPDDTASIGRIILDFLSKTL